MATEKLTEAMGTDVFFWHSYCELLLDDKWVKCTPAFNKSLCDKFALKTLDFDGKTDSLFHAYYKVGNKHMEPRRFPALQSHLSPSPITRRGILKLSTKLFSLTSPSILSALQRQKRNDARP